jgi:transcriptional regulator with XRE-family HTH domain
MLKKRKSNGHGALHLYRSYVFKDKDPVIDRMRTIVSDEHLSYAEIGTLSSVSAGTLHNWFHGETKKPQFATIAAVAGALGYKTEFVRDKDVDFQRELAKARKEIEKSSAK